MTPAPAGGFLQRRATSISPRSRRGLGWTATISRRYSRTSAVFRRRTLGLWHEETALGHLVSLPCLRPRPGRAEQRTISGGDVATPGRPLCGNANRPRRRIIGLIEQCVGFAGPRTRRV